MKKKNDMVQKRKVIQISPICNCRKNSNILQCDRELYKIIGTRKGGHQKDVCS